MRRGPGLAALERTTASSAAYHSLSSTITSSTLSSLQSSLSHFSTSLQTFSKLHRQKILSDPIFRHQFQRMCASIGVDPLTTVRPGTVKGLWNDVLGLQDWNLEIGVQVVDVCLSRRERLGGTLELEQIVRDVNDLRSNGRGQGNKLQTSTSTSTSSTDNGTSRDLITSQDVLNALDALKPLGCGYEVITLASGRRVVRTTPRELDQDSSTLLSLLSLPHSSSGSSSSSGGGVVHGHEGERKGVDEQGLRYITLDELRQEDERIGKSRWSWERANDALDTMLMREGSVWIDRGAVPERYYELGAVERGFGG